MKTVIQSCQELEQSNELELFEQYQVKNNNLRNQLNGMILQSKQVISRLNDMQDWDLLLTGQFKKRQKNFNLQQQLKDIEQIMNYAAEIKHKKVIFEANFSNQIQLASAIAQETIL